MKARHFRKMRENLKNKDWLNEKLIALYKESEEWNNFKTFECSDFFRGYDYAEYNRGIHERGSKKTSRRIRFIHSRLKLFN